MIHSSYRYKGTYIGIPIPTDQFAEFPETVSLEGKIFYKKSEFHMTICRGDDISLAARLSPEETEQKLLPLFNAFVGRKPLAVTSFSKEFRHAKDAGQGRESIVLRCFVDGLADFFKEMNDAFGISLPVQPAHVTLYTLQPNKGIHIPSNTLMESFAEVSTPELKAIAL